MATPSGQETNGSAPTQEESGSDKEAGREAPKGFVPGDALRREEKARKAAEKETADLKRRLQEIEDAGKSETDKLRSQADQLKPVRERLTKYEETIAARAQERLDGLSKDAQKKLAPMLERISDPLDRLDLIESVASLVTEAPRPAPGQRGPPARGGGGMTWEEAQTNPEAYSRLSPEERREVLKQRPSSSEGFGGIVRR